MMSKRNARAKRLEDRLFYSLVGCVDKMEGLTLNIVHKAQKSALRWFSKPKHIPGRFENEDKHDQTLTHAEEEIGTTSVESAAGSGSNDQQVQLREKAEGGAQECLETREPTAPPVEKASGQPYSAIEHDLEESNDQPTAPEKSGKQCETLDYGEDVMLGELEESEYSTMGGIVNGFDGIKNCPVLLLYYELAVAIHKMITAQRAVQKHEREAQAKIEAVLRYEDVLAAEIQNIERHIAKGREIATEDEPDRLENMEEELENLKRLSEGARIDKRIIENNVNSKRSLLQGYQEEVTHHLEEAFVDAKAIKEAVEEEIHVPEISLQKEYEELVGQMRDLHGGHSATRSLRQDVADSVPHEIPEQTPEQKSQVEASKVLWEARENLQYARVQFSEKEKRRQQDFNRAIEAEQRGQQTLDASPKGFDIRWAIRFREITRELIDAEEELSRARLAAKEAGLRLEYDNQSSCFPDDEDDGKFELMSSDIDSPEVFAGDERMIAWMKSLDDSVDPDFSDPAEVDEWGSGDEVDISDSASAVAQGSERKRINKWEQLRPRRASIA